MTTYELRIFLYGREEYRYTFDDFDTARKMYLRQTRYFDRYVQLLVDGKIYNTAKAEKFFGPKSPQEKWDLLFPFVIAKEPKGENK